MFSMCYFTELIAVNECVIAFPSALFCCCITTLIQFKFGFSPKFLNGIPFENFLITEFWNRAFYFSIADVLLGWHQKMNVFIVLLTVVAGGSAAILLRDPVTFYKPVEDNVANNGISHDNPAPAKYKYQEEWYNEMPLDHFSFTTDKTFALRQVLLSILDSVVLFLVQKD